MKKLVSVVLLFTIALVASGDLPVIFPYKQNKDKSISAKRWSIPTLISEEEKQELIKKRKAREAKIAKNFTKKSKLKQVKKKDIKVKVDKQKVDFFDSLEGSGDKPLDME